ncbi:MAG TPA: DUF3142 domain-containing protein [Pyrinomonadaceae bacterium]|nr:DUF3142 domain-containing protein [Pyrinomonadaceae bacterium]
MQDIPPSRILIAVLLLAGTTFAFAFRSFKHERPARLRSSSPATILWAWERPEDLRFIDSNSVGVAYLAQTIFLRGSQAVSKPRLQPLLVSPGTVVMPVTRMEVDKRDPPSLSDEQAFAAADEIARLATPTIETIQIDFDAAQRERAFYQTMLISLRQRLPAATKISITALGSWCQGDAWLNKLPVDETVPMLFRMGIDRNGILSHLAGSGFNSPRCQSAAGISTDEQIANLPHFHRVYVFNPNAWDRATFNKLMENQNR